MMPAALDDEFLAWFRNATERAWAKHRTKTFAEFVTGGVGGFGWQEGTRWLGGLTAAEIAAIESREGLRFPPDYRRFLERLHATDRPMLGAGFTDGDRMMPTEAPGFFNWLTDMEAIHATVEAVFEGLAFSIAMSHLWLPEWGDKPESTEGRTAALRRLWQSAPRLVPVFGHRFLLAEPCVAGNPVLSVVGSDIIVYGSDLRGCLLADFSDLLELADEPVCTARPEPDYSQIPFWGGLIDRC